jgi:patatin-related protein
MDTKNGSSAAAAPAANSSTSGTANDYAPLQELRLAVVMYGGISLAIYMNGVAQELLNLVRATAPKKDKAGNETGDLLWSEDSLKGAGRAYRRLGRLLTGGTPADEAKAVRTRFVVDIVSGTSAGGLNGVFLAKALCNQQTMDKLTDMWRLSGHVPTLLNDPVNGVPCTDDGGNPDALLNGRTIFNLLNTAIQTMDFDQAGPAFKPDQCNSPYVEELDLFVTTTDVNGLIMQLKLQDEVIPERRYRNFFHFRYGYPGPVGEPYNPFHPANHTFLAFASRCTSAFPAAFPPMNLNSASKFANEQISDDWTRFYPDYVRAANADAADGMKFQERSFIDGGCLDNKPFGYVVDALRWKQSDIPVTRKLLYLEPDPEDAATERSSRIVPDAYGTVNIGYLGLPHVENIREDLVRLLERNQMINRVRDVIATVQPQIPDSGSLRAKTDNWKRQRLQDIVKPGNPAAQAYGAYHRSKISAVTDFIANVIVCAGGLNDESDDSLAVRYLVKAWRDENFPDIARSQADGKPTSSEFLLRYDFDYRIRRLGLLRRYADEFSREYAQSVVKNGGAVEESRRHVASLKTLKRGINAIRRGLLRNQEQLTGAGPQNPLMESLLALNAQRPFRDVVQEILSFHTDSTRIAKARDIYRENAKAFDLIAEKLADELAHGDKDKKPGARLGFFEASDLAERLLKDTDVPPPTNYRNASGTPETLWTLRHYYFGYEDYDAATFQILFGTGVGEPFPIEVVRLSPIDTKCLPRPQNGKAKLAGLCLGHFGAFLDQTWRENDILWGRLDAVERIVKGLGEELSLDVQNKLIGQGQRDILEEWCTTVKRSGEGGRLYQALVQQISLGPDPGPRLGTDWKLTPELFAEAALKGAVEGLPRIAGTHELGARAVGTLAGMLAGVGTHKENGAAIQTTARLLAHELKTVHRLLNKAFAVTLAIVMAAAILLFVAGLMSATPFLSAVGVVFLLGGLGLWLLRRWLLKNVEALLTGNLL